jgi:hypothetical protein
MRTKNGMAYITNSSGIDILEAKIIDRLYHVNVANIHNNTAMKDNVHGRTALLARSYKKHGTKMLDLWHHRLGHANETYIKKLVDIPKHDTLSFCQACAYAKSTRQPYNKKRIVPKKAKVLDIFVSDLCGPMPTQSIFHSKYFGTFIDVASRNTFVFFLVHKSGTLDKIKNIIGG